MGINAKLVCAINIERLINALLLDEILKSQTCFIVFVPGCRFGLLHFCYGPTNQTIMIKRGKCISNSFYISNGVRQANVLSPYLFAVYMDDLSCELNKINAGCIVRISSLIILCMLMIYVVFVQ